MRPSRIERRGHELAPGRSAIAKQMPCAGRIMAVLTPITSPRELTSGPPELPGLSAASVCSTSSISRPDCARSERPSADHHAGRDRGVEAERVADGDRDLADAQRARSRRAPQPARAVRGDAHARPGRCPDRRPPASAGTRRPSASTTAILVAPCTTWLLVSTKPSGVNTKPEPRTAAAATAVLDIDLHDRGRDALDGADDRLGVGVEQRGVVGVWCLRHRCGGQERERPRPRPASTGAAWNLLAAGRRPRGVSRTGMRPCTGRNDAARGPREVFGRGGRPGIRSR